jgi:hypothetical protein
MLFEAIPLRATRLKNPLESPSMQNAPQLPAKP